MRFTPPEMIPTVQISGMGPDHLKCIPELYHLELVDVKAADGMAYVSGLTNPDFCCPLSWFKPLDEFEEYMRVTYDESAKDRFEFGYEDMRAVWNQAKKEEDEDDE